MDSRRTNHSRCRMLDDESISAVIGRMDPNLDSIMLVDRLGAVGTGLKRFGPMPTLKDDGLRDGRRYFEDRLRGREPIATNNVLL